MEQELNALDIDSRQTGGPTGSYYVTTPIYYANGKPHLGNAYTTTLADSLARFHRFLGKKAFFLTGLDEHGDKVYQAAIDANKTPLEFTNDVSDLFQSTWKELGLEYSRFIRTTEEDHKKVVRSILQKIYDKGDIYFGEYGGNYCLGCERFLTDKEMVGGKCPDHQTETKYVKEKNYFFRMSKYQGRLEEHITKVAPDFIRPARYKNEVLAMLREPLDDLCISRPKSRLAWGIELPFDSDYVTYVWFDALINYLSGIGYPDGKDFDALWSNCEHLVAKDIVKPHGIFWPTMLMAAEIPLFKHLNVHGYWVTPTGKMSKSLGNVIDPVVVKNKFGMDVFRYFVFREMTFGLDGTFNPDALETRYDADLANNLGNLCSRSLAMIVRYRKGEVPRAEGEDELDRTLKDSAKGCVASVCRHVDDMEIHKAMEDIWRFVDAANVYIDRTKPWNLAKVEKGDVVAAARLDTVLYNLLEALRTCASLLTAFLPETSAKILGYLGYSGADLSREQRVSAASEWGRLAAGTRVERGESLFPRTDLMEQKGVDDDMTEKETLDKAEENAGDSSLISIEEFQKVDLRVGQILEAESIPKADKLLKLMVDIGDPENPRQLVAGIAKRYSTEELVGRKIVVVVNLKPVKLRGVLSEGMLLAAVDNTGNLELVTTPPAVSPGTKIS